MRNTLRVVIGVLTLLGTIWAQQPVATVTSSGQFTLRGAAVAPGQGVSMWPVMAGDNVTAGNALTIVTFPDGSVITLDPGAEAMVNFVNGKPVFQLLSGTAHYSLKSLTAVQLVASGKTAATSLSGALTPGGIQAAGFWTLGHTLAVVGAGAGTAGAIGGIAAATSGGGEVSLR